MNQADTIVAKLQSTTKRTEKEQILREAWQNGHLDFFEGVQYAYDPLIAFNVKQIPKATGNGNSRDWKAFLSMANDLRYRNITGHDALRVLEQYADSFDASYWDNFCRNVLLKDLRCGITDITVNKVLKNAKTDLSKSYMVDKFGVQLAESVDQDKLPEGRWIAEPKLDGVRVVTIMDPHLGTIQQLSRNGKELTNFNHIVDEFKKIQGMFSEPVVFDGEVVSKSFQDLMTQVHRKKDVDTSDAVLYLFDHMTLKEFRTEKSKKQEDRHIDIQNYTKYLDPNKITEVDRQIFNFQDSDEIEKFQNFLNDVVKQGYEGALLKDPTATYKLKKNKNWRKWKPTMTVDLEVVDVERGTGRNEHRIGNLICRGNEDGKDIEVSVGFGYTDAQRDEIWSKRNEVLGHIVEIMADGYSLRQDGQTYSLRFPRFVRFRGFDKGEKI